MIEQYQQVLKKQLWSIATMFRSDLRLDDFRDYVLVLIFYKYLSDKFQCYADEILACKGYQFSLIDEKSSEGKELIASIEGDVLDKLGYLLMPSQLVSSLVEAGSNNNLILEQLSSGFNEIEQSATLTYNSKDFDGLFSDIDFNSIKFGSTEIERNDKLVKMLVLIDEIDFHFESSDIDILGDAYEYLIGMLAIDSGKKSAEFYTPQMTSKLLAKLVVLGGRNLKSVYDPTCGSGSLLLRVAKESDSPDVKLYGQELNSRTYNLARMNMFMHGVHYKDFDIRQGDTLQSPAHIKQRFNAVVANPPYSMSWSADPKFLKDERFSEYKNLAPKSKADLAFVQHMIHHLDSEGTMAVVLPHGVLFRSSTEKKIRQHLIQDKNYLDTVIGLPGNIFLGTSIPTCVLIFKKNRNVDDGILFVDASQGYEEGKVNNVFREKDIERIIKVVYERKTVDRFAFYATRKEVGENDYNLNIRCYVDASPQAQYLQILKEQLQDYEPELLSGVILQRFSFRQNLPEKHFENTLIIDRRKTNKFRVSIKPDKKTRDGSFVLVFDQREIDTRYLELFFNSALGQRILDDCAAKSGSLTIPTLSYDSLHNNLIAPIPNLDVQQACVESSNAIDSFLKELEGYKKDIIFKPNRSKELLLKVNSTLDYVKDTNKIERLLDLVRIGENSVIEFKETFSLAVKRLQNDQSYKVKTENFVELSSLKTIAGFLNARGGTLFVGVTDDQKIVGVEREVNLFHKESLDNFLLHFKNLVKTQIGESFYPFIQIDIEIMQSKPVLVVKCTKANQPCFLGKEHDFYVRSPSGSTDKIAGKVMWDYLQAHFVSSADSAQ